MAITNAERKATIALTTAILEIAEEVARDEGIGVALNAVLSAYGNLVTRHDLNAYGAKALGLLIQVLEHKDSALLNTRPAGRA